MDSIFQIHFLELQVGDDTNVEGRGVDGNKIVEDDDRNWGSASSSSSGEVEEENSEDEELLIDSLLNQNETNSSDNVSRVNEMQLSENWVANTVIPLGTMLGVTMGSKGAGDLLKTINSRAEMELQILKTNTEVIEKGKSVFNVD
ncbi:hypothetical protein IFM89_030320 [Coptis chinensis]|uniref:Uncharacterized protein n=1 Tax=Coptis chinensis TaxID=261450 RepID=A0A835M1V0_9MAGN|nr:hypothetical protein IFM89_030320 [Coptis chinensis]